MKIGILTYHRAHNYGAVLQCYALQEIIRRKGHSVEVIDYIQPYIDKIYSPYISFKEIFSLIMRVKIREAASKIHSYCVIWNRARQFSSFRKKHLICSKPCDNSNIPQYFDSYIIGSDQVWGFQCTNGYDPVFWGNFKNIQGSKVYGYAISGNTDYHKELSNQQIIKNIENFYRLSFREEVLRDDIEKVTGVTGTISLDPTLLSNSEMWEPLINKSWKEKNYIALYQVRYPEDDKMLLHRKAKMLARNNNCDLIDLSFMSYSVEDFVSIIKYAKCVVTSSFHATVFSVIFETPFYAFKLNDKHDGRYVNLLKHLHLDSHLVDKTFNLTQMPDVNKAAKELYLPLLQKESINYLDSILS